MELIQNLIATLSNLPEVEMSDDDFYKLVCDKENEKTGFENEDNIYDCPICKNKGYTYIPQADGYAVKNCKCKIIRHGLRKMIADNLKVSKYTFENYKVTEDWQKNIFDKAKAFIKEKNKWFFIGGISGCGKTHICTAVAISLLYEGKYTKYMKWASEGEKIKYLRSQPVEFEKFKDSIRKADVLYIDDFMKINDADKMTNSDYKSIMEVIEERYTSEKTTIISSEMNISEIINIDMAVGGRIKELSQGYCINIKNDNARNYRLKGEK